MANHLKRDRQIDVLRLLVRFGDSCQDLMKERFQDLTLRHVQVDDMHVSYRAGESDRADLRKAVHSAIAGVLEKAGKPQGSVCRQLRIL